MSLFAKIIGVINLLYFFLLLYGMVNLMINVLFSTTVVFLILATIVVGMINSVLFYRKIDGVNLVATKWERLLAAAPFMVVGLVVVFILAIFVLSFVG